MPRPRIPTLLKIARGNPGKRPLNQNEPMPDPIEPQRPDYLCKAALKWWEYYVPMLLRLKVLTEADKNALTRLCDLSAQLEDASRMIQKQGLMIQQPIYNRDGVQVMRGKKKATIAKQNPAFRIQIELEKQVRALMIEFGLTPSSRTKVTKTVQPEQLKRDPLGELRARAKRSR